MKEEFLHFVWKYRLYDENALHDREGNSISVISPGEYNRDSGPDFFNARIRTGDTEWAGNVEIHIKASDFNSHSHNKDHSYNNIILHIVLEKDTEVFDTSGRELLTAEISFGEDVYGKYMEMISNPRSIACHSYLKQIDTFFIRHWLLAVLVERLERKSENVVSILNETGFDWEETFYRQLIRYFGFRVNTGPFLMLASALPFRIIKKHLDNRIQVEALLYGCAGLLDETLFRETIIDEYYKVLLREFKILAAKYSLKPLHGWIWKFSRLRPFNFPTVRISQLAGMLTLTPGLFSRITEARSCDELRQFLRSSASDYWDSHYRFGKETVSVKKKTGDSAEDILLINAVIPVLFTYGSIRDDSSIKERAVSFLDDIKAEDNLVIREWSSAGIIPENASESQSLLNLKSEYCSRRRCLACRIGARIISTGGQISDSYRLTLDSQIGYGET